MASVKYGEFSDFVLNGKRSRMGRDGVMVGDRVTSYGVVIAVVDREKKTITMDACWYSDTTQNHQAAVTVGFSVDLEPLGWKLVKVNEGTVEPCGGRIRKSKQNLPRPSVRL